MNKPRRCPYCNVFYTNLEQHMLEHNVVYVPIPRENLDNLLAFITTANTSYLTEAFVRYLVNFITEIKKKDLTK